MTEQVRKSVDEIGVMFDRKQPEAVAQLVAGSWIYPEKSKGSFSGVTDGVILAVVVDEGRYAYFRLDVVKVYSHAETMRRFPASRGPEIEEMTPGEIVVYNSRGWLLTFIKTQGAANLMVSQLTPLDSLGNAIEGIDEINAAGFAPILGLGDRDHAWLEPFKTPFDTNGVPAFEVRSEAQPLRPAEIEELLREIMGK